MVLAHEIGTVVVMLQHRISPPAACRLSLAATGLGSPLPDILPGALPQLEDLSLRFDSLQTTLPASWGSSASTLPSLTALSLGCQVVGPLPPSWAHGFLHLSRLVVVGTWNGPSCVNPAMSPAPAEPPAAAAHAMAAEARLPPRWAGGFPHLTVLRLTGLGLRGPIPPRWQTSGFLKLQQL